MTPTRDYEREKHLALLNRIVKVLNMAEGAKAIGNQAEAEAFAAKAQELMAKHKLEMSDLEIAKQDVEDPVNQEVLDPYSVRIKVRRQPMQWQVRLAKSIAMAHFCDIAVFQNSNAMVFIGRASDRKVAMYVYAVLCSAAERLVKKEYRRFKKSVGGAGPLTQGFNSSFLLGFATGVKRRLDEERERLERQLKSTGTALVRLETAHAAVKKYMATGFGDAKNKPRGPRKNIHGYAFERGVNAGRSADMPRAGVDRGAANKQIT